MIIKIKLDKDLAINEVVTINVMKSQKEFIKSGLVEAGVIQVDELKIAPAEKQLALHSK